MTIELTEILNSGELTTIYLSGTDTGKEVVVVDDFETTINTVSQGIDPLGGYALADDRVLVHDASDLELKSAYVSQLPGVSEIVHVGVNLGISISRAEFDAAVPNPAMGRSYLIIDNSSHAFVCKWDGTNVWNERMSLTT